MDVVLLMYLGISPPEMFAGFCGALVNVFWFHRTKPWSVVGTIVAGMFTANYLGVAMNSYVGGSAAHTGAFLVGLFGLKLVGELFRKWRPNFFFEDAALPGKEGAKDGLQP